MNKIKLKNDKKNYKGVYKYGSCKFRRMVKKWAAVLNFRFENNFTFTLNKQTKTYLNFKPIRFINICIQGKVFKKL